jgi:hypothetical protein
MSRLSDMQDALGPPVDNDGYAVTQATWDRVAKRIAELEAERDAFNKMLRHAQAHIGNSTDSYSRNLCKHIEAVLAGKQT